MRRAHGIGRQRHLDTPLGGLDADDVASGHPHVRWFPRREYREQAQQPASIGGQPGLDEALPALRQRLSQTPPVERGLVFMLAARQTHSVPVQRHDACGQMNTVAADHQSVYRVRRDRGHRVPPQRDVLLLRQVRLVQHDNDPRRQVRHRASHHPSAVVEARQIDHPVSSLLVVELVVLKLGAVRFVVHDLASADHQYVVSQRPGVVIAVAIRPEKVRRVVGGRAGVDDKPLAPAIDDDLPGVTVAVAFVAVRLATDNARSRARMPVCATADAAAVCAEGASVGHPALRRRWGEGRIQP